MAIRFLRRTRSFSRCACAGSRRRTRWPISKSWPTHGGRCWPMRPWFSNTSFALRSRRPSCFPPSGCAKACCTICCRRRHAACLLSDIGWRVHPDHRGEETLNLITNGNFGSISHQGRAFIALSVFYRYAGLSEENEPPVLVRELVPPAMDERARVLGAAFRVAHLISAARTGVLPATHFRSRGRKLMLLFEHRMVDLVADRVGNRFKQLARLVGRTGSIVRRPFPSAA